MKFRKPLALVLGAAIALTPLAIGAPANAATTDSSVNTQDSPNFADALAAYNAANAALATVAADVNAANAAKQQAFQAANKAYKALTQAAQAGRKLADKAFQVATKAAKDAFKLAMSIPGVTADQKLAANNLLTAAITGAAAARDAAYRALTLPQAPAAPVLGPKQDKNPKGGALSQPSPPAGAPAGDKPKPPNGGNN